MPGRPEASVPEALHLCKVGGTGQTFLVRGAQNDSRVSATFQNLPDYSAAATQWQLPRPLDLTSCLPQGPAALHPAQGPGPSFAGRLFLPFLCGHGTHMGKRDRLEAPAVTVTGDFNGELHAPSPLGPPRRAPACLEARGASGQLRRALPWPRF